MYSNDVGGRGGGSPKMSHYTMGDVPLRLQQSSMKSLRRLTQETGGSYSESCTKGKIACVSCHGRSEAQSK